MEVRLHYHNLQGSWLKGQRGNSVMKTNFVKLGSIKLGIFGWIFIYIFNKKYRKRIEGKIVRHKKLLDLFIKIKYLNYTVEFMLHYSVKQVNRYATMLYHESYIHNRYGSPLTKSLLLQFGTKWYSILYWQYIQITQF